MPADKEKNAVTIADKLIGLQAEKKRLLSLEPEAILNEIIDAKDPLPLVHSFSEEELHLLINEIGIEDSLPILAMASSKQIDYIFDIEIWEKDRLNTDTAIYMLTLLAKADPDILTKWLFLHDSEEKITFLETILHRSIYLIIREKDQDPSEFGKGFFTFDNTFYIKISTSFSKENDSEDTRADAIYDLLESIASYDYSLFRNLLISSAAIIGSEHEEELFHMKNVRLAEKGFEPYYDAVRIYAPVTYEHIVNGEKKYFPKDEPGLQTMPVPLTFKSYSENESLFANCLAFTESDKIIGKIESEFATVCNLVISAEKKIIRSREELKKIVEKVSGYISIGLEMLLKKENVDLPKEKKEKYCTKFVSRYMLADIFGFGYHAARKLNGKAKKFIATNWFQSEGFDLSFWDEKRAGVLGGMLLDHPLYFANYQNGVLFKEFALLGDIYEAERILEEMIAADEFLRAMNIKIEPETKKNLDTHITYKNLFLTLWLKKNSKNIIATEEESIRFFSSVFEEHINKNGKKTNKLKASARTNFLSWLSSEIAADPEVIGNRIGNLLEEFFKELEEEYMYIDLKHPDSRYASLFLISCKG